MLRYLKIGIEVVLCHIYSSEKLQRWKLNLVALIIVLLFQSAGNVKMWVRSRS
ncbi:MAG: hypothetical protein GF316_05260 [Candidatus Lokiarchaeota archaeon]|nr:hypothetical protein [Candidatus Lokiarchaeota archaeon]